MLDLKMQLKGKHVLVLGLGISGRSAAEFLLQQGAYVTATDANENSLNGDQLEKLLAMGLKAVVENELRDLSQFSLVIISPGIPGTNSIAMQAKALEIETIGEIELACRFLKGRFLAITGTNGKTTVTLLVNHVLNQCGRKARALGNMGTPLTSECLQAADDEILVVELSSYQLETMTSRIIDAGVVLNITPDHLDRYLDMDTYAAAKMRMSDCLKPGSPLYIEHKCFLSYYNLVPSVLTKTYGYDTSCDIFTDETNLYHNRQIVSALPVSLHGKMCHDLENMMAAYALCQHVGISAPQFVEAYASFKKPAHRIEFVKKVGGITYYDDSKGTNIDAVIRAVEMLPGGLVLIAGGVDKGSAYTPWIPAFAGKVKSICAIGRAAEKIKHELSHAIPVELCSSLEDAVHQATKQAQPGDTVLLSPGCSSFDMFRDYIHRGEVFQRVVHELIEV